MVWQCPVGEDFKRQTDCPGFSISLGKSLKSLQLKCNWVHIDRNHIRRLMEKSFMVAWDMHVGFKVQLVVEFYIYPLCLDRSQIQNNRRNTWAGASEDETSAAPAGSIVSLLGEAVPVSSAAADHPLLCMFPQVWEVHLAPGMQFLYACVSQMGSINCLGPFDYNGRLVLRAFVWSTSFHKSTITLSYSCGCGARRDWGWHRGLTKGR